MRVRPILRGLSALLLCAAAPAPDGYTDAMFRQAVYQRQNSSLPFVLVTIVDGLTGNEKTGCTEASALGAALALQHGWTKERPRPNEDEVDALLLSTPSRRSTFIDRRWLIGSGFFGMDRNEAACALLRRGIPAFRADLTGRIVAGSPGHSPSDGPPSSKPH